MNSTTISNTDTITYEACPLCGSKDISLSVSTEDYSISKEPFEIFDCESCSFRFTQHIPSPEKIGPYYQSDVYISHSDTKEGMVNKIYHSAREWMLNRKRNLVQSLTKGKRLLDVGSGTGYFLDHMKRHGYDVQGVEIDGDARTATKKKFGIQVEEPSTFLTGQLPQKVDAITLWHVLEHLHDLEGYMQSIRNQLTNDGVVLIAVPNHASYDATYYKKHWAAYDVPRHLWHFTPETVKRLAEKSGFQVVDQKRLPLDPFYNALLSEQYKGNKLALLSGSVIGGIALLKSYLDAGKSTSPIYVLKKSER